MQTLVGGSIVTTLPTRRFAFALLVVSIALVATGCDESGTTGGPEAPAVPTGLEATSQVGSVELQWDNDNFTEVDAFRVYRSTNSDLEASGSPLATGISPPENGAPPTHIDQPSETGTTYYYVVTAVAREDTKIAESGPSRVVSGRSLPESPDP